jgi:hypothetical protein
LSELRRPESHLVRTIRTLVYALILSALGCAGRPGSEAARPTAVPTALADHRCAPRFPFQDGWWGADGAYSIPLPGGRDLWIFGDTLYGDSRTLQGRDLQMVRNSVGLSTCEDGEWKIEYVLRRSPTGKPLDFFQARHPGSWYWALDGFVAGNELYVTLLCIRNVPRSKGDPWGFETCGADLARVSRLEADPDDWVVETLPLTSFDQHAHPSASAVVDGGYAYVFALKESGTARPMLLTRIPLVRLGSPRDGLQYYAKDGQWKSGFVPDDAAVVMEDGVSEMSVRYHPQQREWIAVQFDPKVVGRILLRTAPQIIGPWTAGEEIYRVPELEASIREKNSDRVCYAAKEHQEFGSGDSILVTYVCNSTVPTDLLTQLDIYVPRSVSLPIPRAP